MNNKYKIIIAVLTVIILILLLLFLTNVINLTVFLVLIGITVLITTPVIINNLRKKPPVLRELTNDEIFFNKEYEKTQSEQIPNTPNVLYDTLERRRMLEREKKQKEYDDIENKVKQNQQSYNEDNGRIKKKEYLMTKFQQNLKQQDEENKKFDM
jgi:ABC-type bacteriocin/lantibiotic exporter with double-glycine peptidase domain